MCHWGSWWSSPPHASLPWQERQGTWTSKGAGQPLPATLPLRNILEVGSSAPALAQGAWRCRVKPFSELNQSTSTVSRMPTVRNAMGLLGGKEIKLGAPHYLTCSDAHCGMWVLCRWEIKYLYGKEKESAFERTSPSLKQDPKNHEQWVSTTLAAAETMDKDALTPIYNRVLDCISCQDSRPIN